MVPTGNDCWTDKLSPQQSSTINPDQYNLLPEDKLLKFCSYVYYPNRGAGHFAEVCQNWNMPSFGIVLWVPIAPHRRFMSSQVS